MKIDNYGTGQRGEETLRLLLGAADEEAAFEGVARIILLPIPTARDGVNISGTDIKLESLLSDAEQGDFVVGYGIPDGVRDGLLSKGVRIYDASLDEKFLAENAELTALGTLGYILTSDTKALCERTVGVVGYGRIGKVLLRYLLFFGARVCLYSTKEATRRELCGYGVRTAPLFSDSGAADFSGVDILINTAPTSLAAAFKNRRVPDSMRVIELASGNNFDGISGVEALPAIPGRMYPKSAGRVYFDGIMRALGEGNL